MNSATLIGTLTGDPERVPTEGSEEGAARFTISIDRPGAGSTADLIPIVVPSPQDEIVLQYLTAGKRVAIDGRLASDHLGLSHVVANRVQFLSAKEAVGA
jgi:single-stranded DNA-binding protein